jgi:hypothetical protein
LRPSSRLKYQKEHTGPEKKLYRRYHNFFYAIRIFPEKVSFPFLVNDHTG